jgi:hypothetical protein
LPERELGEGKPDQPGVMCDEQRTHCRIALSRQGVN